MSCKIAVFVRIAAVTSWVIAGVDISPFGWNLSPKAGLFVIAGACVWSYAWISRAHSRPAVEVYLAGKDIGRREALLEQQCGNVARINEQPNLRIISGGQ